MFGSAFRDEGKVSRREQNGAARPGTADGRPTDPRHASPVPYGARITGWGLLAQRGLADGDRRRFRRWLGATLALGVAFVVGQLYEYYGLVVRDGFVVREGYALGDDIFASAFYGLTGLHGLHVAPGVILVGIVFTRALAGQYSDCRDTSVMTVGMYRHFVDAMWLLVVATVCVSAIAT